MNCTVRSNHSLPVFITLIIDGFGPQKGVRDHCPIFLGMDWDNNSFFQPSCKYSHDWFLSQEQLVTLAKNAKKAPCNFYKNGEKLIHHLLTSRREAEQFTFVQA